ncbi:MAG: DUF3788 family protein [Thermoanaerobaculia bacterium]
MALSAFDDKSRQPAPDQLNACLGGTAPFWAAIVQTLAKDHDASIAEWAFAGAKYGWSMRVKRKARVILYLIPQDGHFLVGVVLGERAVSAAHQSGLPEAIVAELDAARPYAEGRGIRFPVRSREDAEVALMLARVKLAH